MRNQFGGHAVHTDAPPGGDAEPCVTLVRRPPDPARLPLLRRTSRSSWSRGRRRSSGRNGQGKTNLVEAIDYLSRLGSHRVAARRAAGARRRRPGRRPGRGDPRRAPGGARDRDQPGPVQPRPDQQVAAAPGPRAARPGAHGRLLARGPRPGQGRPVRAPPLRSTTCWSSCTRATPACAPTTTGCSSSATRCSRPPRARAAGRRRRGGRRRPGHARRSGTPTWPGSAPRCWPPGCGWSTTCGPLLGKAYEAVARGATRDDATMVYKPLVRAADSRASDQAELEQGLLAELERRRRDELDRGITLVGPHRDDLVLSLGDLPVKGYASHGESWSFALALRLASYDLLRQTGDDPILVLDDVFAELDTGRRAAARRAGRRRRAGAGHRRRRRRRARGAAGHPLHGGRRGR